MNVPTNYDMWIASREVDISDIEPLRSPETSIARIC
jgi:hypothetical protein